MEAPGVVRGRFGHAESNGEADGQLVKAAQLSVRSMNFGQHWRTPEMRDVRYGITLPLAFVAHMLRRNLPEYVEDCIRFSDSTPFEVSLRNRQWPDTEQILDDPTMCALALNWIAHDCLLEWLGDGEPEKMPGYVINTVDLAERQGDSVQFGGVARLAGQPVRFQDV